MSWALASLLFNQTVVVYLKSYGVQVVAKRFSDRWLDIAPKSYGRDQRTVVVAREVLNNGGTVETSGVRSPMRSAVPQTKATANSRGTQLSENSPVCGSLRLRDRTTIGTPYLGEFDL